MVTVTADMAEAGRRSCALRLAGDDARHVGRFGPTPRPFPGKDMQTAQPLREDWLPLLIPTIR